MRRTLIALAWFLALVGSWGVALDASGETSGPPAMPEARLVEPLPDWPYTRFRVAQPRARALVLRACERSRTVREMIDALETSDVIAFFALSPFLQLPTGRTSFMGMAGRFRCVNLVLNERNSEDDLIALLGHELHHVMELAAAPEVNDSPSYERLYQQIGRAWSPGLFETTQAVEVWRQVRRDLADREQLEA